MTPFAELLDLPRQFAHAPVRDLAWTLVAPPLLASAETRHPLQASGWRDRPGALADWLRAQDRDPSALVAWLAMGSDRRLGRQYERLWQFALEQAPGVRLHAANLPLRQGERTLGELDLLLEDAEGCHHLELAVKFYLGQRSATGDDWLGPGGEDHLARKLAHLRDHQLPLSASAAASGPLAALGLTRPRPAFWLGGQLFQPLSDPLPWPATALPSAHRWCTWAALPEGRWEILPRGHWLAPAVAATPCQPLPTGAPTWPLLLVRRDASGQEEARLFLVPDAWPAAADNSAN